jgi:hypothetical protein
LVNSPVLAIFVRVVLTVAAEMPVSPAISEAVIGSPPFRRFADLGLVLAARCGRAFGRAWTRRSARPLGSGSPAGLPGWLSSGYLLAADARNDLALKVLHHIAQSPELIDKSPAVGDLVLDLLEPLEELLGDHADIRRFGISLPRLNCTAS